VPRSCDQIDTLLYWYGARPNARPSPGCTRAVESSHCREAECNCAPGRDECDRGRRGGVHVRRICRCAQAAGPLSVEHGLSAPLALLHIPQVHCLPKRPDSLTMDRFILGELVGLGGLVFYVTLVVLHCAFISSSTARDEAGEQLPELLAFVENLREDLAEKVI
jgi:hypothetical protein